MSVCHTSTGLCADELKAAETRAPRNELQPFRNAPVRVVVEMAAVPCLEAGFIAPVRKKPYLAGIVAGRDHLHPQETAGGVDQMRTIDKSILDLIGHSVRDSKPTQRDEFGAGLLCRAARRTVHSCLPFFCISIGLRRREAHWALAVDLAMRLLVSPWPSRAR